MTRASPARRSSEREPKRETAARASSASMPPAPIARARLGERPGTLLSRARVQPALRISSPDDPAEREAERVAAAVMAMPGPGQGVARRPAPAVRRSSLIAARAPMRTAADSADDAVEARIRRSASGGTLLPRQARNFLEPRFRADFGAVRIHTDANAAALASRIGARAFTFGRHIFFNEGQYRPDTGEGMALLAHELTHTIQQSDTVQRQAEHPAEPRRVAERTAPQVQRSITGDVLDWFADHADHIPGFRLLTVVLGRNPITQDRVERSAANILRALVEFFPGGALVVEALDRYGIFARAGSWIEEQLRTLGMAASMVRGALLEFLGSLSLWDLRSPRGIWQRARRIFTEPIDRLIGFGRGLGAGVLRFIREAILRPLAALAERSRGYPLLKAVLGRDPITGQPVPRTAETLIGGFMTLIGQQEVWENIRRANAIPRAWTWFQTALSGLIRLVESIPERFMETLGRLEILDLVLPTRAFARVGGTFTGFIGDALRWAGGTVVGLLQIVFEVVAPRAVPYLRRAAGAFETILRDPVRFLGTLVRAGIQGFRQFGRNFLGHLRTALIQWLTGAMAGTNVYIPTAFTLVEIVKFTLSALGLTWASLRAKLVRATNETAVRAMETGFDLVRTLVTQGPAAAWQQIVQGLGNLRDMVFEQLMTHVRSRIVRVAIENLVTSLNPVGGFIRAIIAIYDTIRFFIDRLSQIGQVVASFVDSIAAIAAGTIAPAANRVERTMAGLLVLVIGFLANLIRLGDVSPVVIRFLDQVRAPIDRGLDRVVEWIVEQARRLGRFVAQAGVPQDPNERLRLGRRASQALVSGRRGVVLSEAVITGMLVAVKVRYGFSELVGLRREDRWWIQGRLNPSVRWPVSEESANLAAMLRDVTYRELAVSDPGQVRGRGSHADPYVVEVAGLAAIAAHMRGISLPPGRIVVYDVAPGSSVAVRGTWQRPAYSGGDAIIYGSTIRQRRIALGAYGRIVEEVRTRLGEHRNVVGRISRFITTGEMHYTLRPHAGWLGGLRTLAAYEIVRDPVAEFTLPATLEAVEAGTIDLSQGFIQGGTARTLTGSRGGDFSHSPRGARKALRGARQRLGFPVPSVSTRRPATIRAQAGVVAVDAETIMRFARRHLRTNANPSLDEIRAAVLEAILAYRG